MNNNQHLPIFKDLIELGDSQLLREELFKQGYTYNSEKALSLANEILRASYPFSFSTIKPLNFETLNEEIEKRHLPFLEILPLEKQIQFLISPTLSVELNINYIKCLYLNKIQNKKQKSEITEVIAHLLHKEKFDCIEYISNHVQLDYNNISIKHFPCYYQNQNSHGCAYLTTTNQSSLKVILGLELILNPTEKKIDFCKKHNINYPKYHDLKNIYEFMQSLKSLFQESISTIQHYLTLLDSKHLSKDLSKISLNKNNKIKL